MAAQEGTAKERRNSPVTNARTRGKTDPRFQTFFHTAVNARGSVCPVRDILTRISDKWSMLVILALGGYGVLRFNALKHAIGDVSQRMLTVTLRHLEADGIVTRTLYAEVPPRVEYELTPLGHSLKEEIARIVAWATEHADAIAAPRRQGKRST
jgi:DNA-binding HxlR family transcriptional regulator